MHSVPKYLKYAYFCYMLADDFIHAGLVLKHKLLPIDHKRRLESVHLDLTLSSLDQYERLVRKAWQAKFGDNVPTIPKPQPTQTLPVELL